MTCPTIESGHRLSMGVAHRPAQRLGRLQHHGLIAVVQCRGQRGNRRNCRFRVAAECLSGALPDLGGIVLQGLGECRDCFRGNGIQIAQGQGGLMTHRR